MQNPENHTANQNQRGDYLLWHALASFRPHTSATKLYELINEAGGIESALSVNDEILTNLGWSSELRDKFKRHKDSWRPAFYNQLSELGIKFVPFFDPNFPAELNQIYDPPFALYYRGLPNLQNRLLIAFVGSRKASPYGKTVTNMLVRPLASKGVVIVSGLAYGIDAEAHQATVSVKGQTLAIIGNGNDEATLYPRAHRDLARQIISQDGAIISEYPPGTKPQTYFFPQRNRIIAGISRAVVVVEANAQSGALITARLGLEQNRDVFAVPGPITSELSKGTNNLIKEGAMPIQSADELLEALEMHDFLGKPSLTKPFKQINTANLSESDKILNLLSSTPLTIDEIVKRSTLSPNTVASAITILEIDNLIRDIGGRHYVRV